MFSNQYRRNPRHKPHHGTPNPPQLTSLACSTGAQALASLHTFVVRIWLASLAAYAVGQLVSFQIFSRLRRSPQGRMASAASATVGYLLDTLRLISIALWHSSISFMAEHG